MWRVPLQVRTELIKSAAAPLLRAWSTTPTALPAPRLDLAPAAGGTKPAAPWRFSVPVPERGVSSWGSLRGRGLAADPLTDLGLGPTVGEDDAARMWREYSHPHYPCRTDDVPLRLRDRSLALRRARRMRRRRGDQRGAALTPLHARRRRPSWTVLGPQQPNSGGSCAVSRPWMHRPRPSPVLRLQALCSRSSAAPRLPRQDAFYLLSRWRLLYCRRLQACL